MSIPVYQQIKDVIKEEIKQGKYKPGDILPSANQLAKMFSTSRNTAVKAITELAHESDVYTVQGRGTIVNDLRKQLKSNTTIFSKRDKKNNSMPDIGILFADFDDLAHPYFSKMLQGISRQAKLTPCNLKTFCIANYSINEFIHNETFDGLIVATELPHSSVLMLKQNKIPFVLANNDIYGEDLYCVTVDAFSATYDAVKYLHSLGHEKIAVLPGPSCARSTPFCYSGYKHIMSDLKLEFNENYFKASDYGEIGGQKVFASLFAEHEPPTAVFAMEDYIAIGIIEAAEHHSLKIPEELSIIGSGDMLNGSNVKTALTTFDDRFDELGALCLEILDSQLNGRIVKNSKISLKPELIIRDSCTVVNDNVCNTAANITHGGNKQCGSDPTIEI